MGVFYHKRGPSANIFPSIANHYNWHPPPVYEKMEQRS